MLTDTNRPAAGSLHHVELRVPDLVRACAEWGWLLSTDGFEVELVAG